jgi:putative hydrolase of the HAD superfamily
MGPWSHGQPIRAVFCDVGGPIYSDEDFLAALRRALDELRAGLGWPSVQETALRSLYDDFRNGRGGSLRTAVAAEFLGNPDRRAELSALTERQWRHPASSLYDDARQLLGGLAGRVRLGVLANQPASVVGELARDGLAGLIDVWGVSALVGYEKPEPTLFGWALREAGVEPGAALHIGNRLDTDIRPARAAGLRTVWLLRGEAPDRPSAAQRAEADLVLDHLGGLAELLSPLLATAAG